MERERDITPDCTRFRNEFPAYLYGEILPEAGTALEGHVESCDPCRDELTRMRETRGALDRWIVPSSGEDPGALAALVRDRAREDLTPVRQVATARPRRRLVRASAWVLGAAAGLLFALCLFSTEASFGQGRLAFSFALPGRRPAAPAVNEAWLSEDRVRSIAAQEVSTHAASMERSQLELSRMTREELYQEILRLSQATDRALAEIQRLYDERLNGFQRVAEASDIAQRRAISELARNIRPVSNR